jgi:hypothetical protein
MPDSPAGDPHARPEDRPMLLRAVRLLAGLASVVTIALAAATLLVWFGRGLDSIPVSFGRTVLGGVGLVLSSLCFSIVGSLLAIRVPRNPIGWLFIVVGLSLATMLPVNLLVASTTEALRPAAPTVVYLAWARTTFGTPTALTVSLVTCFVFPSGRPLSRGWWPGIAAGNRGRCAAGARDGRQPGGSGLLPIDSEPVRGAGRLGAARAGDRGAGCRRADGLARRRVRVTDGPLSRRQRPRANATAVGNPCSGVHHRGAHPVRAVPLRAARR